MGFDTHWFNPEPHISFIFTSGLLSEGSSLTFCGLSLGPHSMFLLFWGIFFPRVSILIFTLCSQYLLLLYCNIIFFLSCKASYYPYSGSVPTTRSNLLYVYFLWHHLSFMEVALFISLWWSSSWFGQSMLQTAPVRASPSNNAFVGQDTNHSLKGLPEFWRSSN